MKMNIKIIKILLVFWTFAPVFLRAQSDPNQKLKEQEGISSEDYLQRLSSIRKVLERRDPFDSPKASIETEGKESSIPVLQRYPVEKYVLKAVLVDGKRSRALVQVPEGGMAIVHNNERLGDGGEVIKRIDRGGVVIIRRVKNNFGSYDTLEVNLRIGATNSEN